MGNYGDSSSATPPPVLHLRGIKKLILRGSELHTTKWVQILHSAWQYLLHSAFYVWFIRKADSHYYDISISSYGREQKFDTHHHPDSIATNQPFCRGIRWSLGVERCCIMQLMMWLMRTWIASSNRLAPKVAFFP